MWNNIYSRNGLRHAWATKNTNTLTMAQLYTDFEDFASRTDWEPNQPEWEAYRGIWNQIYNLEGDSYLIRNTEEYCTQWIAFVIADEYEKYAKANEMWDSEIERLRGVFSEMNVFNIGDRTDVIEDYDKFKTGRTTRETDFDVLARIKELQDMKTPFNSMIRAILYRILKSFNDKVYYLDEV